MVEQLRSKTATCRKFKEQEFGENERSLDKCEIGKNGAGEGIRTLDLLLGKEAL